MREIIKVNNKSDLKKIIENEIELYGTQCDLNHIDVSEVKDMKFLFYFQYGEFEFNGDVSKWNVSKVTSMNGMFHGSGFKGDISNWDVSSVKNMEFMFSKSRFNGDISNWNVSKVTNMFSMFSESKFNSDISRWNVSNVIDMMNMFEKSSFNQDISKWTPAQVTKITQMFEGSIFSGDLTAWKPWNLKYALDAFKDCPAPVPYWALHEEQDIEKIIKSHELYHSLNEDIIEKAKQLKIKL